MAAVRKPGEFSSEPDDAGHPDRGEDKSVLFEPPSLWFITPNHAD